MEPGRLTVALLFRSVRRVGLGVGFLYEVEDAVVDTSFTCIQLPCERLFALALR